MAFFNEMFCYIIQNLDLIVEIWCYFWIQHITIVLKCPFLTNRHKQFFCWPVQCHKFAVIYKTERKTPFIRIENGVSKCTRSHCGFSFIATRINGESRRWTFRTGNTKLSQSLCFIIMISFFKQCSECAYDSWSSFSPLISCLSVRAWSSLASLVSCCECLRFQCCVITTGL